jgi:hypothetical protein
VPAEMLERLTSSVGAAGSDFPVFTKAPLYLRESLVFPYNQGMRFQDALFHKLGRESFDEVFTRPPLSTQQIIHPGAYMDNKKPTDPEPPLPGADKKKFRVLADGSLGEFDHSVLLRQYVNEKEGAEAASHWRGGSYRLYEHKHDKYNVLTYSSEWDSPKAAQSFFTLYQRVLKGKWKKLEVAERSKDQVSGSGDSGRFQLTISGSIVQSIEGLR